MAAQHKFKVKEIRAKEYEKFIIRLPLGLKAVIKQQAEKNHRSMNSEILVALEAYFKKGG